jgi:hypothetical protein
MQEYLKYFWKARVGILAPQLPHVKERLPVCKRWEESFSKLFFFLSKERHTTLIQLTSRGNQAGEDEKED